MNNTIRLLKGSERLDNRNYKNFSKGDSIFGDFSHPKEIKRWSIKQEEEAKKELEKYHCEYEKSRELWYITEYALEYFEADEDGEFISGSDYNLAETEKF